MKKKNLLPIIGFLIIIVALVIIVTISIKDDKANDISNRNKSYEQLIFDDSYVHTIDILINDEDWEDLQTNPTEKIKYKVDVIIDDEKIKNVSFKTKGNSSLNQVASGPKTERYSYKINFGKYIDGQTFHGLNKLHLNNMYADATYLKDYISYDIFRELGVPTPLTSFVFLKINGRDLGVYLAVEEVGDSFLKRNNLAGALYKPEQEKGDSGASLKYIDDDVNNYPNIFDNAENEIVSGDKTRLVSILKQLSNQENIDNILNTDEIIKYFVAHNFVLSYDSYTGPSIHNYYLFEENGKLSMLPWDYNMAYGAFGMGEDDTFIINYGIDTPLYGADASDRPMWNWIISNEEYLNKYHSIMNDLINNYFESGKFDQKINNISNMITPYLDKEKSIFYKSDQIKVAIDMFNQFCNLRAQSIRLQLNGTLSAITTEQDENNKVDGSNIDITLMGLKTGSNINGHQGQGQKGPQSQPNQQEGPQGQRPNPDDQNNMQMPEGLTEEQQRQFLNGEPPRR